MTTSKAVRRYVRIVSRKLTCYKLTRYKLLDGLTQELSQYSELSYEELCKKVGSPTQTALQLMEGVGELEVSNVMKTRRVLIGISGGLLISAVLVLGIYYIQVQHILRGDFYVKEHIVETDVIYPADMTDEEILEQIQRQEEIKKSERHKNAQQGE